MNCLQAIPPGSLQRWCRVILSSVATVDRSHPYLHIGGGGERINVMPFAYRTQPYLAVTSSSVRRLVT